jgi:hypothetical protein
MVGLRVNYPEDCHAEQLGSTGPYTGTGNAWAPGYETCQNTLLPWRLACVVVFFAFFFRWQSDNLHVILPQACVSKADTRLVTFIKFLHLHVCTFVLEVLGGAGAVWGASEIVGPAGHSLRLGWGDEGFGQESFDSWRWICLATFSTCLLRWAMTWQARERVREFEEVDMPIVAMLSDVRSMNSVLRSASGMVLVASRPSDVSDIHGASDASALGETSMMSAISKMSQISSTISIQRAASIPSAARAG